MSWILGQITILGLSLSCNICDLGIFWNLRDKFLILNEFDLINMPYTIDVVFMKDIEKQSLIDSILKEGVVF